MPVDTKQHPSHIIPTDKNNNNNTLPPTPSIDTLEPGHAYTRRRSAKGYWRHTIESRN